MEIDLAELEKEFRDSWRNYDPNRYAYFLSRTVGHNRLELLARLLGAELEYCFQPPIPVDENETVVANDEEERIRPSVQLFVLRFPELSDQNEILIRLSVLEYALRLRHDRVPPNPDSYLTLCKHAPERLINLLRLTEHRLPISRSTPRVEPAHPSDSTVKESQVSVSVMLDPLPYNIGCFLLVKLIGRGGMGYVHSAIDLRSTAQVAVKVMRRIDPWSVYRFIEEFTWLSQLNHPNLVKLYDAFSEGDVRYFSMEMVEGRTIRQWFERLARRDEYAWSQLRRVLGQAASAIHFLHKHNVIHCDIKCSNLMITSRRRAVLLDLGLAVRDGNMQPMVGTLQYMAPEVLEGAKPSRQSDWYSFGILLFEVMTDSYPPIEVDLSAERSEDKYRVNHQKLSQQLASCDPELTELCRALLHSDPNQRPSGACVLQRLGLLGEENEFSNNPRKIVGREKALQQLDLVQHQSLTRSMIALVTGEPGIGKSSLLDHWLKQEDRSYHDHLVLRLRCYRQDHTPLRLLNVLVQELVQGLKSLPEPDWRITLQTHLKEIGDAFPQVLQLVEDDYPVTLRSQSATPKYLQRNKGLRRLEEWLVDLSQSQRMLLVVDDAQWADEESLQLFVRLICTLRFRGLVIAVDESGSNRIEQMMQNALPPDSREDWSTFLRRVELGPLSEAASVALLTNLANEQAMDITPGITKSIAQRAEGSPFLLLELFRAYCHYSKRDGISDEQWLQADSHSSVKRRFSLLPIQSENVLQYLAVAGQKIGFHQLQMVSRILPHELQRTLSLLAFQGWVRSESNNLEADVEIAHDNFRKVVLQSLPTDRLHRRHFRMARMLSSEVPPPWARMGNHYWEAERFREAAACYLEAARAAFKSSAYQDALRFLWSAEFNDADRTPREREDILRLKADCLAGSGNATAAAEIYDTLGTLSEDVQTKLLYQGLAGEQWIRGGQIAQGTALLSQLLTSMGITNVQSRMCSRIILSWRTLYHATRDNSQEVARSYRHAPFSALEQCLNRVSILLVFLDNQLGPNLILHLKRRAADCGTEFDEALAVLHWGMLLTFAGSPRRRIIAKWLRRGSQLARSSDRPAGRGSAQLCIFLWNVQKGNLCRAMNHAHKAIDWYQREPNNLQWEIQFLYWGLIGCYWHAGRLSQCRETTAQLRLSAMDRSDSMSLFLMNVGAAHWSDLVSGDIEQARNSLAAASTVISNECCETPFFFVWISSVFQDLYEGQPDQACQILQRDWKRMAASNVFRTNHYHWLAICARLCCDLVQIRRRHSLVSSYQRDAHRSIGRLFKLRDPAFVAYGKAFALVLQQATHPDRGPTPAQWQAAVDELHVLGHHLMAGGLAWHQSLAASLSEQQSLPSTSDAFLRDEGCLHPQRLMDIILPLPTAEH